MPTSPVISTWIPVSSAVSRTAVSGSDSPRSMAPPGSAQRMTADQLDAIAEAFNDLLRLLRNADPRDRAELYSRIGLRLTYQPGPETVIAEVVTPANGRVFDMCPEGDVNPYYMVKLRDDLFLP
jgi:site-specific DNA recombinase